MDNNWVAQQKIWLQGQYNAINQVEAQVEYNMKEIGFHQAAINIALKLRKHYETGIENAQADLDKHLTENTAQ